MKQDLILQQKLYDFTIWMTGHTAKFPKSHRFSFAVRIENLLLETLGLIQRANHSKQKQNYFEKIDSNLDELKLLIRLSKDLTLFPFKSYEFAAKNIEEIGRIFGGWSKSQKGIS